jgi:protein TIF31
MELPATFQYSCFHLEHKGKRINDFIQLSEVKDLTPESELQLVEDPYTEKDARIHVIRVRELLGAAGDRTDTLQGILSGISLHDSVNENHKDADASTSHPVADYDFQAAGSLATLLPHTQATPVKTIKAISVSPWNPPPYHLRQKGHLLYLQVTTNEGEQHQITSHVGGFYVNKSSNSKFDPFPRATPKAHSAHSLLSLISELSPSFNESFTKLQDANNQREPLATYQITNATPATPWTVPAASSPLCLHQSDITRTQESYLISGIENPETLRDWNEEFQSTRELPKDTAQDRVFRERLTSKLFADYNDAAARGAVLVARGEVAPLNPTEGRDAQIFVYNNVFFSFGADGVGTFASEGGDEAARVATGKDVMGVRMVNQLDIDGLFTPGTVVVDYLGKRLVGQSIVPGIFKQRDPGENQIDYGAVDGKEVVASDERFVPIFEKLSKALKVKKHSVWDKSGQRHELEGSVETKGLLGTDGRKYVLDLYRVTPLDITWMEENGTSVNSPQANGSSETAYPHRMTVLRPELVDAYWKSKMREWVNGELERRRQATNASSADKIEVSTEGEKGTTSEANEEDKPSSYSKSNVEDDAESSNDSSKAAEFDKERINIADFTFALNPDAFSGQEPQIESEKEEWAKDEQEVRSAADFLRSSVIPELVRDLKEGDVGFPMDGQSLSRLLHRRGINIRYLGKLATLAEGKRLEALRVLSIQEMVSRSFKHVAGKYLRYLPVPFTSACIAHLLNCLLGTGLNAKPSADIDESLRSLYPEADIAFKDVSPESLRHEIEIQVTRRYRYTLEDSWSSSIKPLQLLREVSMKLGLQIESKDYRFNEQVISTNGAESTSTINGVKDAPTNGHGSSSKKKKKATRDGSPASTSSSPASQPVTFVADDILNIVPIIKEASPKSALAEEALEAGRISIMQGQKKLGQELLLESLSLHEQIYGILHPEVARVYNTLSMLYYQLEEKEAAVELARKAVIVSERTLGVDSAETLLSYLNLGLFGHANGETKMALAYIKHALELWKVIYGPNHPDSITTINNAAVMLQHLKFYHESRLWFEASLNICENVFGKQSINAATLLFQLAQALALDQDSKASVNRMRESYNIFLTELGPTDKNTKEAESWLEQLTQNAVSIAKQAKDLQARRLRAGIRVSPRVTLGQTQPQPQVGQTTEAASGRDPRNVMGLDSRSIDELLKFIEGSEQKKTPKKRPGHNNPKRRGGAAVGAKA